MKIYAISGLGADKRVFEFLNLSHEIVVIDWINPEEKEGIASYAMRMAKAIDQSEEYIILGVSFGGLIATEISKKLNPRMTILISSAETNDELRWIYRLVGKLKLIEFIPTSLLKLSRNISPFLFGAKNKSLLLKIIDDTDLHFAKWALRELMSWSNKEKVNHCLKISGTKDLLIPPQKLSNKLKLIKDGGHFMIVDNAEEISKIINEKIISLTDLILFTDESKLDSTCYIELLPGIYKDKCWNKGSVYIDAIHSNYRSLEDLFEQSFENFDSYSFQTYSKSEWLGFLNLLQKSNSGRIPDSFIKDFSQWLKDTLENNDEITFLGL